MILSQLTAALTSGRTLTLRLPGGNQVPQHFHVTEVGASRKTFIDCGGKLREESRIVLQLWTAADLDHRLEAKKLSGILESSEKRLDLEDLPIDVEYQGEATIETYRLELDEVDGFKLANKETACLALESCGIPGAKQIVKLATAVRGNACAPGSGCC